MKIVHVETVLSAGEFADSKEWHAIRLSVHKAIKEVDWPPGSGTFAIYPEYGKERGKGNGVKPIKNGLIMNLVSQGWKKEARLAIAPRERPGPLDAIYESSFGLVALEWETGNISSSHRAINKMSMGLLKGVLIAGILVVPSRKLYPYLTDRIGNYDELIPYLEFWRSIPVGSGVLEIIVIEHDKTSFDVPKIPKGTSGRALQ